MTLIVSLVLLIMITLATIASYHMSSTSMNVVSNMQFVNEAVDAASSTIAEAVSTTNMFNTPANAINNPCSGNNTRCFDLNNDGTNDITVTLNPPPTCIQSQPIPNSALNLNNAADRICATGVAQVFGVAGAVTGTSLCSSNLWEVTAVAADPVTETNVTVVQGVSVRAVTANAGALCP